MKMLPQNSRACFILTLLYFTASMGDITATRRSISVDITPRRMYIFQSPVKLTFSYPGESQTQENITRFIKVKVLHNKQDIWTINERVRSINDTTLEIPCEIFSKPGTFSIQYFVEGVTKRFRAMRKKIIVRMEQIRLSAPNNHTAASGSVVVWITNNQCRYRSHKGRVQLYWIKALNNQVLVTSKKIGKNKIGKRARVQFDCNIFDTEGIFYFKYISRNRVLARSNNMTVSWGIYKLEAQLKNIFPCADSFAVKFTSPYCDKSVEDRVEIRSKDFDNVIATQSAYPGFRSIFLPCITFKRHIQEYCFYYITKSSLTNTETIQAKLCLPSLQTEFELAHWTKWTEWGSCFSPSGCGHGRKIRLRFCETTSSYPNGDNKSCNGSTVDSTLCFLPPCKTSMGDITATRRSISVDITPRRMYIFQSPVKLTFSYPGESETQENITRFIKVKVLYGNKQDIWTINERVRSINDTTLEIPCEIFSKPGTFSIQYFVEGVTKRFREIRKTIIVRMEQIRLSAPNNHTAASGSVVVWITNNQCRYRSHKGRVQLYWIKALNDQVLVTSKKIGKNKIGKRARVQFDCNIFDTEGIFYFKYISGNRVLARSNNMTVSWGIYKLEAQSKNIFPCADSFAVKFTSPYCDKSVEDRVEIKSKDFDNFIATRSAYPGFRSIFLPCITFKRHIREYCFYYITKSSLTNTETIQAKLCLPSLKTEFELARWTKWTEWGSCFSPSDCGLGRKIRLRFCETTSSYPNADNKPCGNGPTMDSTLCSLPPCKIMGCKSCGCVFDKPEGTIVSPESLTSVSIKNKSNCRWWIKVETNKKVKMWFDTLRLAKDSVVRIMDGNHSNSKILERVTLERQKNIGDIFASSNIISISYYFDEKLNGTNSGFQLSYSSVDKPRNHHESSQSQKKKLVKMTFIGILALMVVVMAAIFLVVFCKMRQHACDEKSKTSVSQPTSSSFQTSTACMSDSTLRSSFETPASGDESMNNNLTLQRVNYRARVSRQSRMENKSCVHVCPKCDDTEICDYLDSGNTLDRDLGSLNHEESVRLTSYGDYHEPGESASRSRHYSAIKSFRTESSLSDEVTNRHFSRYL